MRPSWDFSTPMGCRPRATGAQRAQCLKAYLAELLGLLNVEGLPPRAVDTQGTQCLKSFPADQMGLLNVDGLHPGQPALKACNA